MSKKLKILFISHRIPYPPNKGDKIRSYAIISALKEIGHRVSLAFLVDDPDDMKHISYLSSKYESVTFEQTTKSHSNKNLLKAGLTGKSLSMANHFHPHLKEKIEILVKEETFDIIYYFSGASLNYYTNDESKKIIDFVDADSCKWESYAKDYIFPINQIYKEEAKKMAKIEAEFVEKSHLSLFVSKAEAEFFKDRYTAVAPYHKKIQYLNNSVDTEYFTPEFKCDNPYNEVFPTVPYVAVFTGVMDYKPNIDAVEYFVHDIMPSFEKDTQKSLGFAIIGRNPTKKVKKLGQIKNVFVSGAVDDIRPYILHADVSVNPLNIARGVQNKILESMSCGKTVLTSVPAFEGIEKAQPNIDLLVCHSKEEWVLKLREALFNESMRRRFGENAREIVTSYYTKEILQENLQGIIKYLL